MDKYVTPHPLPNEHEREILIILMEEAAEIQQAAAKLLRFGKDDGYPGQERTNAQHLSDEIGELEALIELATHARLVNTVRIRDAWSRKREKLRRYMQTQRV